MSRWKRYQPNFGRPAPGGDQNDAGSLAAQGERRDRDSARQTAGAPGARRRDRRDGRPRRASRHGERHGNYPHRHDARPRGDRGRRATRRHAAARGEPRRGPHREPPAAGQAAARAGGGAQDLLRPRARRRSRQEQRQARARHRGPRPPAPCVHGRGAHGRHRPRAAQERPRRVHEPGPVRRPRRAQPRRRGGRDLHVHFPRAPHLHDGGPAQHHLLHASPVLREEHRAHRRPRHQHRREHPLSGDR